MADRLVLLLSLVLAAADAAAYSGVRIGERIVSVEMAVTPTELQRGLQHRTSLDPDRGMLFVLPSPGRYAFWMKDTLIPLDMLWLDASGRVVHMERSVPPCGAGPCESRRPSQDASFVLEIGGGRSEELGVRIGDRLLLIP